MTIGNKSQEAEWAFQCGRLEATGDTYARYKRQKRGRKDCQVIPGTCEHRVALFMNEARDRFDDQQLQMVRDLVWEIFHCPKKYQAEEIRDMQSYILDRQPGRGRARSPFRF
ncbi:MAG: hypothetical protein Q9190_007628 [Brigantiaea leucoxantha]